MIPNQCIRKMNAIPQRYGFLSFAFDDYITSKHVPVRRLPNSLAPTDTQCWGTVQVPCHGSCGCGRVPKRSHSQNRLACVSASRLQQFCRSPLRMRNKLLYSDVGAGSWSGMSNKVALPRTPTRRRTRSNDAPPRRNHKTSIWSRARTGPSRAKAKLEYHSSFIWCPMTTCGRHV